MYNHFVTAFYIFGFLKRNRGEKYRNFYVNSFLESKIVVY